jgi:hypothetical protein
MTGLAGRAGLLAGAQTSPLCHSDADMADQLPAGRRSITALLAGSNRKTPIDLSNLRICTESLVDVVTSSTHPIDDV